MTTIFSSGTLTIPDGTFSIPSTPFGIPSQRLQIDLARDTTATPTFWTNVSTVVDVALEVSYDGGNTWLGGGSFAGSAGGIALDKNGNQLANSTLICTYVSPPDYVRGTIVVSGPSLVTQITVSVS